MQVTTNKKLMFSSLSFVVIAIDAFVVHIDSMDVDSASKSLLPLSFRKKPINNQNRLAVRSASTCPDPPEPASKSQDSQDFNVVSTDETDSSARKQATTEDETNAKPAASIASASKKNDAKLAASTTSKKVDAEPTASTKSSSKEYVAKPAASTASQVIPFEAPETTRLRAPTAVQEYQDRTPEEQIVQKRPCLNANISHPPAPSQIQPHRTTKIAPTK
jgi:hypothetical protein